ncbi:hypothetical protein BOX17_01430 [Halomonas aestuarii]|uniref:Uncharacterized protein n=1 Tax=Halomonas aestuarii TaxID=1897729 RepID=A0A1J0VCG5_9GAMM|nr:hypothetical protein [Halomonas aestuarii]APE29736.1 hypothetical protein BOX17_01430 [Halomonas aestuarii]
MSNQDDLPTLKQDDRLAEPLRRVSYEAGMMLGLEATRDEQAYHRRRLTRHQYWLHGHGTLAGLNVSMDPDSHDNDADDVLVRLQVSPGIAIDGLGREVLVHETYCINLRQWLDAQSEGDLLEGFDGDNEQLWLKVSVRQKDCPLARQPVLTRKLNLSTDSVQPSRTADSVQLELIPELPPAPDERFAPWASHPPVADAAPSLTAAEQQTLDELELSNPAAAAQLSLHARLLHALDAGGVATTNLADDLEAGARLLLARISISTADPVNLVVNPQRISINNLVRPFLTTASQLAWLKRQG